MNIPRPLNSRLEGYLTSGYDLHAYQLVIENPSLISSDRLMDLAGLYNRLCPSFSGHAQNLCTKLQES